MSEQSTTPSYRPTLWKIVAAALAGLLIGVLVAVQVTSAPPRYRATSTLALLPGPQLATAELPDYWEVLSRGQATRTSALVLGQPRWLAAASIDSGDPAAALALAAGAIPDTSLISVTMEADTSKSAELALRSVIQAASTEAAGVSGPFVLNVVGAPEGSAVSLTPDEAPVLVAGGLAGLLIGAGLGLVAERALVARRPRRGGSAADLEPRHPRPPRQRDSTATESPRCGIRGRIPGRATRRDRGRRERRRVAGDGADPGGAARARDQRKRSPARDPRRRPGAPAALDELGQRPGPAPTPAATAAVPGLGVGERSGGPPR